MKSNWSAFILKMIVITGAFAHHGRVMRTYVLLIDSFSLKLLGKNLGSKVSATESQLGYNLVYG